MRPRIKLRDQLHVGVRPEALLDYLGRRYPELEFVVCRPDDRKWKAKGFEVVGECRPTTLGNSPRLEVLARIKLMPMIDA